MKPNITKEQTNMIMDKIRESNKYTPDHNCTIAKMAEQLGIKLWQMMEAMKFAGKALSDKELRLLLPKKKVTGYDHSTGCCGCCSECKNKGYNEYYFLVRKALSGRLPRELSNDTLSDDEFLIPEEEKFAHPKDTCTCKEPKQTYPGQDYCRRCGELIKDEDKEENIKDNPKSWIAWKREIDKLKQENEELKAAQQRSLQSFAEHHEAEVKDLQERLDWFDNLVEYKVKGKYACLKDYVESLEKRIQELEKACIHETRYCYKHSQMLAEGTCNNCEDKQALSKGKE